MRSALTVVFVVLLVATVSAAMAQSYVSVWEETGSRQQGTSSWYGNTGLIVTPTAAALPPGEATVQYHRVQRDPDDVDVWGINVGVIEGLEVGGTRWDVPGDDDETVANAKYRVPAAKWLANPDFPDVAIGCMDLTNEMNRGYYLVLSKSIQLPGEGNLPQISLHLGFGDNDADQAPMDGVFGGIELAAGRRGLLQAEYDGEDFNAALRVAVGRTLSVDLGLLDGDFGYGATYRSDF